MYNFTTEQTKNIRYFLQSGISYYEEHTIPQIEKNSEFIKFINNRRKISRFHRPFFFIFRILFSRNNQSKLFYCLKLVIYSILLFFILKGDISRYILFGYLGICASIFFIHVLFLFMHTGMLRRLNKEHVYQTDMPEDIKAFLSSKFNTLFYNLLSSNKDGSKILFNSFLKWGDKTKNFDKNDFINIKLSRNSLINLKSSYTSFSSKKDSDNYYYDKTIQSGMFFDQQTLDLYLIYDFSSLTQEQKEMLSSEILAIIEEKLINRNEFTLLDISQLFIDPFLHSKERELTLNEKLNSPENKMVNKEKPIHHRKKL